MAVLCTLKSESELAQRCFPVKLRSFATKLSRTGKNERVTLIELAANHLPKINPQVLHHHLDCHPATKSYPCIRTGAKLHKGKASSRASENCSIPEEAGSP